MNIPIKEIFGYFLIIGGTIDAIKYLWHVSSIRKAKTSKAHSRKFANAAIFQDLIKMMYGFVIADIFIVISSISALITMFVYFYTIYSYYPYRRRNVKGFKRPNVWVYFINSLLPNKYRRHL